MAGLFILFSFVISGGFLAWIVFRYVIFTHFPLIHSGLKLDVKFLLTRTALVLGVILGLWFLYWLSRDALIGISEYLDNFIFIFLLLLIVHAWYSLDDYLEKYNSVVLRPKRQAKQRAEYLKSLGTEVLFYVRYKALKKYIIFIPLPVVVFVFSRIYTSNPIPFDIKIVIFLYYAIVFHFLSVRLRISAELYLQPEAMEIKSYFGKTQFIPYEDIVELYPNRKSQTGEVLLMLENGNRVRLDMSAKHLGLILETLMSRLVNLRRLDIEDYLPNELWRKSPDWELIEKVKKRVEKNKAIWENATN